MSIAVHTKPIVVGGGVFGEDGWESTWLQIISLIMGHHGNKDAFNLE